MVLQLTESAFGLEIGGPCVSEGWTDYSIKSCRATGGRIWAD